MIIKVPEMSLYGSFNKYTCKIIRAKNKNIMHPKIQKQPSNTPKQQIIRNAFSLACNNIKLTRIYDIDYYRELAKKAKLSEINTVFKTYLPLYALKPQRMIVFSQVTNNKVQDDADQNVQYAFNNCNLIKLKNKKAALLSNGNNAYIHTNYIADYTADEYTIISLIKAPETPTEETWFANDWYFWDFVLDKAKDNTIDITITWKEKRNRWVRETVQTDLTYSSDILTIFKTKEGYQEYWINNVLMKKTYNKTIEKSKSPSRLIYGSYWTWGELKNMITYFFAIIPSWLTEQQQNKLYAHLKDIYNI